MAPAGRPEPTAQFKAAERLTPADRDDLTRLTERAGAIIGIATGVFGVLLAVGFVFLPASTPAEKTYVLFTCLALSIAAVTGIGVWRSARRFGVTAASACVAVICLAALSMTAQSDHPVIAPASPMSAPSPPASPAQSRATAPTASTSGSLSPTSGSPSPGASVTVTGCGLNQDGTAYADLSITNHTSSNSNFYIDVGFYQHGHEFDDNNTLPTIGAGSTYEDTVSSNDPAPGRGAVSCKVLQVNEG